MTLANVIWPSLFVVERYYSWWAIGLGLLVEFVALRVLTNEKTGRSIVLVLVANTVTAAIGYFAMPWITFVWDVLLARAFEALFGISADINALSLVLSIFPISVLTAFPEWLIIRIGFRVKCKKMAWLGWWFANAVSVTLAVLSLFIWKLEL